jgi:Protein of unknown function (DUF1236)
MRKRILLALVTAAAVVPAMALAQDIEGGARRGAAAGAQVLGPVGAAVGGIVGGAIGVIEPPPPPVVTYVEREDVPSVVVEKDVVVGEPLPETVVVHRIPDHPKYAFAVVNHERVIVEPHSRKVIKIIRTD